MAVQEIKVSSHPYGVREGTNIWSGYSNPQVSEKAPAGMTVLLIGSPTHYDGIDYFYAQIESPPDRRGEHIWLAKRPKQEGWI